MQVTDESKEQVLMGVQRLRNMAQTARASHGLATELSISLSPSSNWKNGPPLIRPLELIPLHPVAQRRPTRPVSAVTNNFTIDVNQIPSSSDDFGDEDDNSSGDAEVAIASTVGGGKGSPVNLTAKSGPASNSRGFFSQLVAASACKRSLSGELINHHQNANTVNNNVVSAAANSDQETRGVEVSSRASDEEESGSTRKKLRLSKEQSALLEESFKEHSTLNPKQKNALAKQLNLRPRQVEVWFQNRRARTKLKQTEVDCELLKRCCETLTEENRRLHKELQELRALKVAAPCVIAHDFYMPLPAATLTMCPSCERVATTIDHTRSPLNFSSPSTAAANAAGNSAGAPTTNTNTAASNPPQIAGLAAAFAHSQRQQPSAAC